MLHHSDVLHYVFFIFYFFTNNAYMTLKYYQNQESSVDALYVVQ